MSIALFVALCHNARKNTNAFEICYQINKRIVHNSYESLPIYLFKDLKRTKISTHTECVINIPLAEENCTYGYLTHIEMGIANLA